MPEHQVFVGPANAILSSIAPRGKVVSPGAAPDELVPAELHLKLIAATKRKHRLLHSADPSIVTIENAVPDKLCEAVSADMSAQLGTIEAPMVYFDQTSWRQGWTGCKCARNFCRPSRLVSTPRGLWDLHLTILISQSKPSTKDDNPAVMDSKPRTWKFPEDGA